MAEVASGGRREPVIKLDHVDKASARRELQNLLGQQRLPGADRAAAGGALALARNKSLRDKLHSRSLPKDDRGDED